MPLLTRKIGNDRVPEIGLGLLGLSVLYGSVPSDEDRFKVLDTALKEGCTFWDTADIYGDSEDLIGKWFKRTGKRDQIFLATKFGIIPAGIQMNGTPEYMHSEFDKSLKRLGVDMVDLYYLHRADKNVPIEITIGAMAELVKQGKVKYIGLSEISAQTLRRAHAVHPITVVQVDYSPFFLDIEDEKIGLLKACRELGVTVVACSPLGRGMLTGKYKSHDDIPDDDWGKTVPKFNRENFPNLLKVVDCLKTVGEKYHATPGQVALAWILAQGNDIIPIPGTKKIKYLKENMDAVKVKLTTQDLAEIREVAQKADSAHADRYPPDWMPTLFVDTPSLN